ncbi:hypothetical protein Bbelb_129030 [Branchiostoma belcheri]|nr:hypothetical protein Bbelb_129030 [Branchiostoma belcheri]
MRAGKVQRTRSQASKILASALRDHWLFCNIYTIGEPYIASRIEALYTRFLTNINRPQSKRSEKWKSDMNEYNASNEKLFDIFCENKLARQSQETRFGVKMGEEEWQFLHSMRNDRKGYCEEQVDRKWERTMERKNAREKALEAMQKKEEERKRTDRPLVGSSYEEALGEATTETTAVDSISVEDNADDTYTPATEELQSKRRKIVHLATDAEDKESNREAMPQCYQHLRVSARKVKPEFYRCVDKLISVYHCSHNQAVAGIVETANILFGRKWKYHTDDEDVIDLDTVPHESQIRQAGKAILALALAEIVELMMASSDVVITYHDDGSKKKGCGSFSVQGITIDGKYRAFPTLPISSETRENLTQLRVTVLNILSVVSNGKYTAKDIQEKVTFKLTDGVSHNFGIEEMVALELGTDHIPDHLLCHTHPVLMFNRELINLFSSIEQGIGSEKIFSKFLVTATNQHNSITEQYIHCITNLFSPDFNHKAWNQSAQFSIHMSPKKNLAVGFRKERFNRFVYLCAVILYLDPYIWSFLAKYEHVTNSLACIVRAFESVEFLKVHLAVGALFGVHLVEPFLAITTSTAIDYSKLTLHMKELYLDLTTTDPRALLDTSKPAFGFITQESFQKCKYSEEILSAVANVVREHSDRIVKVVSLALPKLAEGFHRQRADVFGFGNFDENSELLVSKKDQAKLQHAPINNIAAERHVGSVQHELSVRGACQLAAASSSIVKAKSIDLIELKPADEMDRFRSLVRQDGELVALWKNWRESQKKLEEKGLSVKEAQNEDLDRKRNADLDKLKSMGGPFTKPEEVDKFVQSPAISEGAKVDRLYLEVRYSKATSLSLPKTSPLFKLKENYKNLTMARYASNFKTYLSKISCRADVSWEDFDAVVSDLSK